MLPHTSGAFGDLLDPRFQKIFHEQYDQYPDMLPELFNFVPHNGRDQMSWAKSAHSVTGRRSPAESTTTR